MNYQLPTTNGKNLQAGLAQALRIEICELKIEATPRQELELPQSGHRLLQSGFGAGQAGGSA